MNGSGVVSLLGLAAWLLLACGQDSAPAKRLARREGVSVSPIVRSSAEQCGQCHPRQAAEWSQSVMGHSAVSPMFNALELMIEEQVGRHAGCEDGAGVLRKGASDGACFQPGSGHRITGAGGPGWCVNCHAPADNLESSMPPWSRFRATSRRSVRESISPLAREGITCVACHQLRHADAGSARAGNPSWRSFLTGIEYPSRPEDRFGLFGIANSAYRFDATMFSVPGAAPLSVERAARAHAWKPGAHRRPSEETARYMRSSEMCGSCHDVRLFGADVLGAQRGERFKRLRNAYSEWRSWSQSEQLAGRRAASCQDCHMSTFPGVCVPASGEANTRFCPPGMQFEARDPGRRGVGPEAADSPTLSPVASHYFTSVDLPFVGPSPAASHELPGVDVFGTPLSARLRRNALLARAVKMSMGDVRRAAGRLRVPIVLQNVGAGHRVPAGFSQERELWVHLRVEDATGRRIYEVGRTEGDDEDLRDKIFIRVNTDPASVDGQGRPRGLFGADVVDGPDVPAWKREAGVDRWVGHGLINLQNGFLRCVRCRHEPVNGRCVGTPGESRASRFEDGVYDLDTGRCESNLSVSRSLFEVYFPVGALDAQRGLVKGPDAIIDTRSLQPGLPRRYTYDLPIGRAVPPFTVRARLLFRSLPPFLVRAFAAYEAAQVARGRRPGGPLVTINMLKQLERVELVSLVSVVR